MNKIFLDCGAWEGTSLFYFTHNYPHANSFIKYAFECNPSVLPLLRNNIKNKNIRNAEVISKAVWIEDSSIKLKRGDSRFSESDSLIKEKRILRHDDRKDVMVGCIDFSKWCKNNISESDYVICKMNIEGAEYQILQKMIEDETIGLIDYWYIDWHWNKIDMSEEEHIERLKMFENTGAKYTKWGLEIGDMELIETYRGQCNGK